MVDEDDDSDDYAGSFVDVLADNLPFVASALVGLYLLFDDDDADDIEQRLDSKASVLKELSTDALEPLMAG